MILLFPDTETFRLVLTGGVVPSEGVSSEAGVAFGADGRLSVETDVRLTRKAATELTRLGVTQARRHLGPAETVSCWPQVLPATRDPNPPQFSSQAPVLFELESAADLPTIVGEMLRLGNDRQSVRWLADGDNDRRVLLRVVGPPYYTLLRALDQTASGTKGAVRAYVEHAPRVWVQVGYTHELASRVKLDEGRVLLVRPPRDWTYLPDTPFRDVYEVLQFQLPASPVDWAEAPATAKLAVPLRLAAGNAADAPDLWVLRGDAAEQLDAFVRDADERLTQRLKFAVATSPGGETVIVLRVTASKLAPPVLPLAGAVGFKPYYKLPNLYLPAGTRLHPTLRRDAVRKLLADDTDQLVWLYPGPDGVFTPETIPEDSFRPLEDWVDYVIEAHHAPLAAWVESSRFDFEHFVCTESGKPPRDPGDGGKGKRRARGDAEDAPLTPSGPSKAAAKNSADPGDRPKRQAFTAQAESKKPSEWEVRRKQLQDEFLAYDGPLDMPDRLALWPELAVANDGAGDRSEASLCWVNALWGQDAPPLDWADGWLRTELGGASPPVTAAEFDRLMKPADPQEVQARQFAALVYWLTHQEPVPGWLAARLPAVKRYLETNERKLPMRATWLVASRLATLTGADTLGLARVRDRLLQRLLDEGVNAERDLPFFLRSAGLHDSDRLRQVRAKAVNLHQVVRTWAETSLKNPKASTQSDQGATLAYIDLFFAFAFAKLGEASTARQLVGSARQVFDGFNPADDRGIAARFLLQAFTYRIEQALAGKPHTGLLDRRLIEELGAIHARANGQAANSPYGLAYYVITRLQQQSRILEPQERLDPYAEYMRHGDELKKALSDLSRIKDPNTLARTVRELYRSGVGGRPAAEVRFSVLHDALPLSARVGEQFTFELIDLVPEVMKASAGAGLAISELSAKQGMLLEQALRLAGHFDRKDVVQHLVDQFVELLRTKPPEQQFELINVVASQCLRSLRRLQLRDEIDKLLRRMQDVVLGSQEADRLRQRLRVKDARAAGKADLWGKVLRSLLHLAGGWLTFGLADQATPILDDAREELLGPNPTPFPAREYTLLAQAYVATLGHGPADTGLTRIVELFGAMDPTRITNSFTSAKFYSRFHLNLVEETVMAVVSDDFALGPAGRRWLDEDEFLVRRRIHRDMKRALAGM